MKIGRNLQNLIRPATYSRNWHGSISIDQIEIIWDLSGRENGQILGKIDEIGRKSLKPYI